MCVLFSQIESGRSDINFGVRGGPGGGGGGDVLDDPRGSEMVMLDITRDALAHGLCNLTVCSAYFLPIRTRGCQEENS